MQLVREPERPLRDWGADAPVPAETLIGMRSWVEPEELEDELLVDDLGGVPGWEEGSEEEGWSGREADLDGMSVAMTQEEEDEEEWEELGMDLEDVLESLREESTSQWLRPILVEVSAASTVPPSLSPSSSTDSRGAASPSTSASGSDWDGVFFSSGSASLRRRMELLVYRLRQRGYEASVCTTAWASSQGVPAGSHAFIDIAAPDAQQQRDADAQTEAPGRVAIDLDFASHFEVVKGTPAYEAFLQRIPSVFVGSEGTLLRLLELLVEAMRISLAAQNLPVAPWRRLRFVNAKWTAVVDRTVPALSSPALSANTPATTFTPALGAPSAYPQRREEVLSQSLPAARAMLSGAGAGAVGAAPDSLPQFYSNLVNLSSSSLAHQGSAAPPMLAEPALLSALAAKAARGTASPVHPKKPQQHQGFGVPPLLRQAGFTGHLSGAPGPRSPRPSLLKDMVACSH